ncbi:hypothetical protein V6Z11_A07G117400 [Gossypium hirsutum]
MIVGEEREKEGSRCSFLDECQPSRECRLVPTTHANHCTKSNSSKCTKMGEVQI